MYVFKYRYTTVDTNIYCRNILYKCVDVDLPTKTIPLTVSKWMYIVYLYKKKNNALLLWMYKIFDVLK